MDDGDGVPAGGASVCEVGDGGHVVIRVHVQPGAGRQRVVGRYGDALKVAVAAPPERGRANQAVCRLLAEALDVPERCIEVVAGSTSRRKRVVVATADPVALVARLAGLADR